MTDAFFRKRGRGRGRSDRVEAWYARGSRFHPSTEKEEEMRTGTCRG